jgi:hypothetical protein
MAAWYLSEDVRCMRVPVHSLSVSRLCSFSYFTISLLPDHLLGSRHGEFRTDSHVVWGAESPNCHNSNYYHRSSRPGIVTPSRNSGLLDLNPYLCSYDQICATIRMPDKCVRPRRSARHRSYGQSRMLSYKILNMANFLTRNLPVQLYGVCSITISHGTRGDLLPTVSTDMDCI